MAERLTIHMNAPRVAVSSQLYGIFFEEINHAGEGGLYAEMVQNRDFEMTGLPGGCTWAGNLLKTNGGWYERKWFENELHGWSLVNGCAGRGSIHLDDSVPLNRRNLHAMRIQAESIDGRFGVANDGFYGMHVQQGCAYELSLYARTRPGEHFDLTVTMETPGGDKICARGTIENVGGAWRRYTCRLDARGGTRHGRLVIAMERPGTLWLDLVSLFPAATFCQRPNGMRPDLAEMLRALEPAFVRFPGGAIVGGLSLDNRIQWRNSIGDLAQRVGTMNLWGYYTSNGLGFHEYLQLCEDLGAAALWVCNPGMADSYRHGEVVSGPALSIYIQEALDALEYALGPSTSGWGARRAANGHAQPFPLRYIEIGNEASGEQYHENYVHFQRAIRAAYPGLAIISNQAYDDAPVEIVDHHYYGSPEQFFSRHSLYDQVSRAGPEVYVGEYGCNKGVGAGNLMAALSEAAFLIGLERNSDVVRMSSYAPLLFHVQDASWPVNLIGFDNARAVGRSSYHVQRLFACNRPDSVLPTDVSAEDLYCIGGLDTSTRELVLKTVNAAGVRRTIQVDWEGLPGGHGQASVTTLSHSDPQAENTLDDPDVVSPVTQQEQVSLPRHALTLEPWSLTVVRIGTDGID
jgi:alpha-L-arabinofuranosidase